MYVGNSGNSSLVVTAQFQLCPYFNVPASPAGWVKLKVKLTIAHKRA